MTPAFPWHSTRSDARSPLLMRRESLNVCLAATLVALSFSLPDSSLLSRSTSPTPDMYDLSLNQFPEVEALRHRLQCVTSELLQDHILERFSDEPWAPFGYASKTRSLRLGKEAIEPSTRMRIAPPPTGCISSGQRRSNKSTRHGSPNF